jgi:hypothetical protein
MVPATAEPFAFASNYQMALTLRAAAPVPIAECVELSPFPQILMALKFWKAKMR